MLDLPKKTKKVKAPKNDSEEVVESKKAEFVPVRGQKTAFNKIKKIKGELLLECNDGSGHNALIDVMFSFHSQIHWL